MNETADVPVQEQKPTRSRTRSPGYPAISLKAALDMARVIWAHEKRNPAPVTVLAANFQTNPKSSQFLMSLSALKKYGLFEEAQGGKESSFKLTDTALYIILNDQEDAPQRVTLLKLCALFPKIHAHLWKQFNGELPSDANLSRYLI